MSYGFRKLVNTELRHTWLNTTVQLVGKNLVRQKTSLGTCIPFDIRLYKITKIVRALWLAERSVCMRVCKHGCSIKMLCFSRANHESTKLKKFSSLKLDKFTLFTHSFVGWDLKNRYKEGVSIFFRLCWYFKREKSVFSKASFLQIKDWLRVQALCTRLRDC